MACVEFHRCARASIPPLVPVGSDFLERSLDFFQPRPLRGNLSKLRFFLWVLIAAMFLGGPLAVAAQTPVPATRGSALLPPDSALNQDLGTDSLTLPQINALRLPALKAVIVVGPLNDASVTTREINNAEKTALELEANGVSVTRLYSPNTNWAQVQAAATGAQFFMYRGHGIYWDSYPNPPVGGIELDDAIYSNDVISSGLKLAPNAIVMIYSCFSSGSSDTDPTAINLTEARRRVVQYAEPYLDMGVGGYFASWYPDAFQMYIRALFQGMTLGQAFQSYAYDPAMTNLGTHPTLASTDLWLGYVNWDPYPIPPYQYINAFAGKSGKTLEGLFAPLMQLSGKEITVLVKPNTAAFNYQVNVNSSWAYTFNWSASDSVGWINTTPTSGQSGGAFTVQVIPGATTGIYDSNVTVSTSDPLILNKTEQVHVRLVVTNTIYTVFVPLARR
jgi:hypothetical protein